MYDNFLQSKIAKHCIAVALIASVLVSSVPGGFAAPDRSDAAIPVAAAGVAAVATALIAAGVLTGNTEDLQQIALDIIDYAGDFQIAAINTFVTSASLASSWVSQVINGIDYKTLPYDTNFDNAIRDYIDLLSKNGNFSYFKNINIPYEYRATSSTSVGSSSTFSSYYKPGISVSASDIPIFTYGSYPSTYDFTNTLSYIINPSLTLQFYIEQTQRGDQYYLKCQFITPFVTSIENIRYFSNQSDFDNFVQNDLTLGFKYWASSPYKIFFAFGSDNTGILYSVISNFYTGSYYINFIPGDQSSSVSGVYHYTPFSIFTTASNTITSNIVGQYLDDQTLTNGSYIAIPADAFDNDYVSLSNYADTLILDSNGDVVLPYPGVVPGVLPGEITTEWDDYDITDTPDDVQLSPDGTTPISRIPILGNIADALRKLWELLKEGFNKLLAWLQSLLDALTGLISGIVGGIVGFFGARFPDIPDLIDEIINLLRQLLDLLGNLITSLPAFVVDILAFISGYTVYQTLFNAFLPAPVALVCWTFWLVILGIGVFRMVLAR